MVRTGKKTSVCLEAEYCYLLIVTVVSSGHSAHSYVVFSTQMIMSLYCVNQIVAVPNLWYDTDTFRP